MVQTTARTHFWRCIKKESWASLLAIQSIKIMKGLYWLVSNFQGLLPFTNVQVYICTWGTIPSFPLSCTFCGQEREKKKESFALHRLSCAKQPFVVWCSCFKSFPLLRCLFSCVDSSHRKYFFSLDLADLSETDRCTATTVYRGQNAGRRRKFQRPSSPFRPELETNGKDCWS